MLSWELDPSEPLITPAEALGYYRKMMGDAADPALPDLLVATFQTLAFDHLAGRIGDEAPSRWPTPAFWPLARGELQGRPLAVVRLPVGAPHAAMALELMIAAGVRTILAVGSAGSIQPHLPLGSLVIPTSALRHEGTSYHYLPRDAPSVPALDLVDALASAALRRGLPAPSLGPSWTTDAPYRECAGIAARHRAAGVLVVEMEAAALFAVAAHRGARIALTVAVSDELRSPWSPGFHTLTYRRALLTAADLALDTASRIPSTIEGNSSSPESP